MKFKFNPSLEYQHNAINAVVSLFEGNQRVSGFLNQFTIEGVSANVLTLSDDQILSNLQTVQNDEVLQDRRPLLATTDLESMDFSVEMETGTGKTYVYLRTIMELYESYGWRKFIVIVPSVAIREGVLSTLENTREHFAQQYDNLPYSFYKYDSGNLSNVFQFATSTDVEIMVMTLDSFNKDSNIFNQRRDSSRNGRSPLEIVQATNPILILDEPQNMESKKAKAALASLRPLAKLRYSATHRNEYNKVYSLTPVDAYNLHLVKQIQVASVVEDHDQNLPFIELISVESKKTTISAKVKLLIKQKSGPAPKTRTVRHGQNLYDLTKIESYRGYTIGRLDAAFGELGLEKNGAEVATLSEGENFGPDHKAIARAQIEYTIRLHMQRAHRLRRENIKTLSLFFIDQVDNYKGDDAYIRQMFDEAFNELKTTNSSWAKPYRDKDPAEVQSGYFSAYKSEKGMKGDSDAFELIMRDKARLLSFEEPVEFIFSHSALREGWDNPNVFQICTLRSTRSAMSKRQEIGRGLRLAVNQSGERITDNPQLNLLTVVANESYREYVGRLQNEYETEFGEKQTVTVRNARNRKIVTPKQNFQQNPYFQALWKRINQQTRYRVQLDNEKLVSECLEAIKLIQVQPPQIKIEHFQLNEMGSDFAEGSSLLTIDSVTVERRYTIPNAPSIIAKRTNLTRKTITNILKQSENLEQIGINPAQYIDLVTDAINRVKRRLLVDGIQYEKVQRYFDMSIFQPLEGYENTDGLNDGNLVLVDKSIYEYVLYESTPERDFASKLDQMREVKLFIKLPSRFMIDTPVGTYNPDWAIVYHHNDGSDDSKIKLYMVRETKDTLVLDELRDKERLKIICGEKHFEQFAEVDFAVATGKISQPNDFLDQIRKLVKR